MRTLLLLTTLCLSGCLVRPENQTDPTRATLDDLLTKINERLALMQDVARYKWVNKRPIDDPKREEYLLEDVDYLARQKGLNPAKIRQLFRAQIEASKGVQEGYFKRWEPGGGPQTAGSLDQVRERIDKLNEEIVEVWKKYEQSQEFFANAGKRVRPDEIRKRAEQIIVAPGVDETVRELAIHPLVGS